MNLQDWESSKKFNSLMFGIKTFFKNAILYPTYLYPNLTKDDFPEFGTPKLQIYSKIYGLKNLFARYKNSSRLDQLFTYPHDVAINVWRSLLPYSPNHLGNWSIKNVLPDQESASIERDLIHMMIDLYHGNQLSTEGYMTSGATEGNIYAAWLGRKFLEKQSIKQDQICLLKTSLTHYSIEKAADICALPTKITPMNEKTWGMDPKSFNRTITKLHKEGYRGFLIPLTLGYTTTGTADPVNKICLQMNAVSKKLHVVFYAWIDAALNGLIEPFLNDSFTPFSDKYIYAFVTDFHKFGFAPIPSGLILYRKKLRSLIEKPIPYLEQKDNTLLGSRPGVAPVACWAIIHALGKNGFKKIIAKNTKTMHAFINAVSAGSSIKIIARQNSLHCALVVKKRDMHCILLEKKFGLHFRPTTLVFSNRTRSIYIAKAFFVNA